MIMRNDGLACLAGFATAFTLSFHEGDSAC